MNRRAIQLNDFFRSDRVPDNKLPLPKPKPYKWWLDAMCRGMPPEAMNRIFFPVTNSHTHHREKKDVYKEARTYCGLCPVRAACLESALEEDQGYQNGFRGGLDPKQRLELYRELKARSKESKGKQQ